MGVPSINPISKGYTEAVFRHIVFESAQDFVEANSNAGNCEKRIKAASFCNSICVAGGSVTSCEFAWKTACVVGPYALPLFRQVKHCGATPRQLPGPLWSSTLRIKVLETCGIACASHVRWAFQRISGVGQPSRGLLQRSRPVKTTKKLCSR